MKKQSLFQRALENSYLLFVFALVISLVIWVYMSFNSPNTDTTFTISDVPIQIELSEASRKDGLQAFTAVDPKATVTVAGNRTVLGLVNENDLSVTASGASINATGDYTLPVTATKRSNRGNFQITASSPASIAVTVDYLKESEFEIEERVTFIVEDGYYGNTVLAYNTVNISGPQTQVQKIKKVIAKADIAESLNKSRDVDAELVLLDENDKEVSKKLLTMSLDTVKATVMVMPEKSVPIEPTFTNKPKKLQITDDMISVTPKSLLLAGPAETLDALSSVQLEPIDFSKLKNEKIVFDELSIKIPENCKSINNYTTARVVLDLSSLVQKDLTVDRFVVEGLDDSYVAEVTSKSINVTVYGAASDIEKLQASDITAVIDTSNAAGKTGSVEMPVTFRFKNETSCWVYGTAQANVSIYKIEE